MYTPDDYLDDESLRPIELPPPPAPPPAPRFGGRAPMYAGMLVFALSIVAFGVVLANPFAADPLPVPLPTNAVSPVPSTARFAQPNACVRNQGSEEDPDLVLADCGPGVLVVLDRLDSTSDPKQCEKVPGYLYYYFYNSELAGLDFVLCLGKRP